MKISNLIIQGYRSISDAEVPLTSFSIFIGRNNSGKSNILSAIRFLFEGSTRTTNNEDFFGNKNQRTEKILVRATLSNIYEYLSLCDHLNRSKIESCITNDTITIQRKATLSPFDIGKIEILDPDTGQFGTPTGIDAALRPLLPEIIYIEAFKDPSVEATGKSTTILGKMLKQILTSVSEEISQDLSKSLIRTYKKLNITESDGIETDKRLQEIKGIERQINKHICRVFPDHSVRLSFEFPKVEELISQSALEMYDNGVWSSCERKGQGNQRILYFALLQALADQLRNPKTEKVHKPLILLIEEPEAFLYPKIQRQIGNTLDTISQEHQVIIATHSSSIVTPLRIKNVIITQKNTQLIKNNCYSTFYPVTFDLNNEDNRHFNQLLATTSNSDFLFSDYALIVEGISDKTIIEAILFRRDELFLSDHELAIIDCGSKDNLKRWSDITTSFNIKSKCLADLDFLWRGANQFLPNDQELSRFCSEFWNLVRQNGLVEKNNAQKIKEGKKGSAFKIINERMSEQKESLISKLKTVGVWVLSKGEIENYVNLSLSKKSNYTKKAQEIREKEVSIPTELKKVIKWCVDQ